MTRDPEALRYQRPLIRARVLDTLSRGPASERTLAVLLDCELHVVATCIKSLRAAGMIRRLGPTRRKGSIFVRSSLAMADSG